MTWLNPVMLAESYVHRLDPVLVNAFGVLPIRYYGLSYMTGFVLAWLLMRWMAKTGRSLWRPRDIDDLMVPMLIGVMVGGRLGYALGYDPALLWTFSGEFPFWSLLALNKGGMASHGGIIGVIIAAIWFASRRDGNRLHTLDLAAFAAPLGLGLGRVANFINGELPGKPLPEAWQADPPGWSIKYPDELFADSFSFGEQESAIAVTLNRLGVEPQHHLHYLHDELLAGNQTVIELVQPHLTAVYPSALIQALTDGPILFIVLLLVWWKTRRPGMVGAMFLIAYSIMRLLTEHFFRAPDEDVPLLLGLQRGQLISVPMLVIGAGLLAWFATRPDEPVGAKTDAPSA